MVLVDEYLLSQNHLGKFLALFQDFLDPDRKILLLLKLVAPQENEKIDVTRLVLL
jgi:hypothetical protein